MMKLGRKVLVPSEASRSHELRREEVCGGVVPATVPRVVGRVEMEATRVVLTTQILHVSGFLDGLTCGIARIIMPA
ncbi:hypothetical protein Bca101_061967 [Brassica carinata]